MGWLGRQPALTAGRQPADLGTVPNAPPNPVNPVSTAGTQLMERMPGRHAAQGTHARPARSPWNARPAGTQLRERTPGSDNAGRYRTARQMSQLTGHGPTVKGWTSFDVTSTTIRMIRRLFNA